MAETTIGILAGMGPRSTVPFIDLVVTECIPAPLGDVRISFQVRYDPSSPDTEGTSTIPGLEFYAVAVIVSALNGHAGVQLGELAYSNQLAGA